MSPSILNRRRDDERKSSIFSGTRSVGEFPHRLLDDTVFNLTFFTVHLGNIWNLEAQNVSTPSEMGVSSPGPEEPESARAPSASDFESTDSSALSSLRAATVASERNWDTEPRNRFRLRESLKPFIPYLDKPPAFWSGDAATHTSSQVGSDWIDINVIRSWIQACEQHQGECYQARFAETPTVASPTWLVDVRRFCLVRAKPGMRYYALSYVWGPSSEDSLADRALRSNIDILQKERALDDSLALPKTISHAMQLTALLEEDYLWVDRLCIVQDAGRHKQDQLNSMPDIYANAVATIVAANGTDARDGLSGIRGITGPRRCHDFNLRTFRYNSSSFVSHRRDSDITLSAISRQPNDICVISGQETGRNEGSNFNSNISLSPVPEVHMFTPDNKEFMTEQAAKLMKSKWYSRGWTFQEQIFSCRKIVFQGETVNWECACTAWSESQGALDLRQDISNLSGEAQQSLRPDYLDSPLPDFYRFARLVSLYNRRYFTYPEDVMDAFAGIITKLSPKFAGGFLTGLPQMLFDSALLWQPYSTLTRRVQKKVAEGDACLPSWSWVGWHGDINSESWRSGYDYMRKNPDEYFEEDESIWYPTSWRTTSTVKWYHLNNAGISHSINVTGQCYRDDCLTSSKSLPKGWSRHTCDTTGKDFFLHDSHPSQEFWYPIPLGDTLEPSRAHIHSKFISCQTRRAFLRVGETFWNSKTSLCFCADLLDRESHWVGFLRYHCEIRPEEHIRNPNKEHELIELSAGSVLDQKTEGVSFDEWIRPGYRCASGKYEFYSIMAIERVGDIAYRKAVGRVQREAWEKLATEVVDIILG